MLKFILAFLSAVRVFIRSRQDTTLEVLALRQQVAVLQRKRPRPRLNRLDRYFWSTLRRVWPRWTDVLVILKPETVIGCQAPRVSGLTMVATARRMRRPSHWVWAAQRRR